jgi:putative DNA primase/helicase
LRIADLAGGDWPERARAAALTLSAPSARDNESLSVELLRDIKSIFDTSAVGRIASADLRSA